MGSDGCEASGGEAVAEEEREVAEGGGEGAGDEVQVVVGDGDALEEEGGERGERGGGDGGCPGAEVGAGPAWREEVEVGEARAALEEDAARRLRTATEARVADSARLHERHTSDAAHRSRAESRNWSTVSRTLSSTWSGGGDARGRFCAGSGGGWSSSSSDMWAPPTPPPLAGLVGGRRGVVWSGDAPRRRRGGRGEVGVRE
jgi:hypothetical protein